MGSSPMPQEPVIGPIEDSPETTSDEPILFGAIRALWGGKHALGSVIGALSSPSDVTEARPWWKRQVVAIGPTVLLGLAAVAGSTALLMRSTVGQDIAGRIGLGRFWSGVGGPQLFSPTAAVLVLVLACLRWRGRDPSLGSKRMPPGTFATVVRWGGVG